MIAWAVETLVASTLLMLVVLVLRAPVRRTFGPDVAYALWLLPLARMALPPLPAAVRPFETSPIGIPISSGTIYLVEPIAVLPSVPQGWGVADMPGLVLIAWAVGALGFFAWHVAGHARFCRRVLASGASQTVAQGRVRVIRTAAASGPLAFGVWHRYVAFPNDFAERYDEQEQTLALAHELSHHARGDLLANWLALAVLAAHWFNPVAWRAFRAFRADQELACDAMVLARATPGVRHAYGRAIVKSAHGGAVSAACHLHTINELKGRLKMLSKHRTTSRTRLAGGSAGVAALALAALAATASGTQAAETLRTTVTRSTGIDIARIDVPAARLMQTAAPVAAQPPAAPNGVSINLAPRPAPAAAPAAASVDTGQSTVTANVDGEVVEGACGREGTPGSFVINRKTGNRVVMVVCTDRITTVTANATNAAMQATAAASAASATAAAQIDTAAIERNAMQSAMLGLRGTREAIATNPSIPAEARAEALKEIDESIRELEAEIAPGR